MRPTFILLQSNFPDIAKTLTADAAWLIEMAFISFPIDWISMHSWRTRRSGLA